ncbi:hypothetical protein HPP92_019471 [Vanilla planifolia]|uniref:Uncharacterized protein n=1 Tax=Vanilla planifolia TaxID=51239 RepID=A0A835UIY5_VANPL|nr:hypothetical protein HPP92_019471 [Vanilla planifolia]
MLMIRVSSQRPLGMLLRRSPLRMIRYFSSTLELPSDSYLPGDISSGTPLNVFTPKHDFSLRSTSSEVHDSIENPLSQGLTQKSIFSIISSSPRALELRFIRKWPNFFSELGRSNLSLSSSMIQKFLEQSVRFNVEPMDFVHNWQVIRSLGLSNDTTIRIFEELPFAFIGDGIDIGCKIEFLKKKAGVQLNEINSICQSYPEFLSFHINGRLKPLFSELYELGFSQEENRKLLLENPRLFLSLETGELSRCLSLLQGLKCRTSIKERILKLGRLRAALDVKLRIDFLCSYGLSRRDVFKILHVEPRTILYSLVDLEKKIEFLLQKIGYSIDFLVEFPDYLGVNLEKQIISRLQVVELLKSMGGLGMKVDLKHLVRLSRRKFYNLFVKPYSECEQIFGGSFGACIFDNSMKPKHPIGLWKLFKPQRYYNSHYDIRNMKGFMETMI